MGLFNTEICPICEKQTGAFKKTMVKYNDKYVCRDCYTLLIKKGLNIFDIKRYTLLALKNIIEDCSNVNNTKNISTNAVETRKLGTVIINGVKLNSSNISEIKNRYIAFDIETTGLNSFSDRIIELGAVIFEAGLPISQFSTLVNPNMSVSPEASRVNKITNDMILSAPHENEVYPKFIEFMKESFYGNTIICAHNASFDIGFLKNTLSRLGYDCNISYIDTLSISKSVLYGKISDFKQDTIADYFNIENKMSHRAVTDAETCGKILFNLIPLELENIEKEIKYQEKCKLTDIEKVISAYFQKIIDDNFDDKELFGFRKNASGYVDACYLYNILRFKYTKNGFYIILPSKYANKMYLKKEACSISEGGTENVRVYFNNPKSLESIVPYIITEYKKAIRNAKSYMNNSQYCENVAYQTIDTLTIFSNDEVDKYMNIIDKMDLDEEIYEESKKEVKLEDLDLNYTNDRVPLEETKNYDNSSKGFDEGFIFWEKGEEYRKNKAYDKAIEMYDKSRYNGYDASVLYDSYAMTYHSLKDYGNEIAILSEGIYRAKKSNYYFASLEARKNKAIEIVIKNQENEEKEKQKKENREKQKLEKIEQQKLEKEQQKLEKKPIEGRIILQLDDNGNILHEYISISEAVRVTGINSKSIRDAANGVQKHAGGFVWKFKNNV